MASTLEGGKGRILPTGPSVKYVLEGEALYRIKGRTYRIRPGNFLFVEAGLEVDVQTLFNGPTIGLCVNLGTPTELPDPVADPIQAGDSVVGLKIDPLAAVLARYARLLQAIPDPRPDLTSRIVREIAIGVDDYLVRRSAKAQRLAAVKPSTRIEIVNRVERARAFIHENADQPVTLETIARFAALSRFHLTRSFTEVVGLPPLAYHRWLRLRRAADMLAHTSMTATEVAHRLGYSSLVTFSRAFEEGFGRRPSMFRRDQRCAPPC